MQKLIEWCITDGRCSKNHGNMKNNVFPKGTLWDIIIYCSKENMKVKTVVNERKILSKINLYNFNYWNLYTESQRVKKTTGTSIIALRTSARCIEIIAILIFTWLYFFQCFKTYFFTNFWPSETKSVSFGKKELPF